MNIKCECEHCHTNIEFDLDSFIERGRNDTKIIGQEVQCPVCQKNTLLYLPNNQTMSAERIKPNSRVEDTLEVLGAIFMTIGILAAIACVIGLVAVNSGDSYSGIDRTQENIFLVAGLIGSIIQGLAIKAFFDALKEIIGLLRKLVAKS